MISVNGVEIKDCNWGSVFLKKVICNGVVVFEDFQEKAVLRTAQQSITLRVATDNKSDIEVWNSGERLAFLKSHKSSTIVLKDPGQDVIIKGRYIVGFYCEHNQLTYLNVRDLTHLELLDVPGNQLKAIDIYGLTNLAVLDISSNQLTALNVQGLTEMRELYCNGNQLSSLDAQDLTSLQWLDCSGNQLSSLDVQGLTALQRLDCSGNQLAADAFIKIFNDLPNRTAGSKGACLLYNQYRPDRPEGNYKDFTKPPQLVTAFQAAKTKGWKMYKDNYFPHNLL